MSSVTSSTSSTSVPVGGSNVAIIGGGDGVGVDETDDGELESSLRNVIEQVIFSTRPLSYIHHTPHSVGL